MGGGRHNWELSDTAFFLHAELLSKVSGARVGRVVDLGLRQMR